MKYVRLSQVQPSMLLARPIYAEDGRVLLNAGVELSVKYVERLEQLGFPGVYITTDDHDDLQVPDVVCQETRQTAIQQLREVFASIQVGKTFEVGPINKTVNAIIDEIAQNPNVLVNLTDIRSYDSYTFAHSVNVCVLSVIMGLRLGLNELKLHELAVGAMLHDIGKIAVPADIILKPGALTNEEMTRVREHAHQGWEILRKHQDISLLSAHVAYQHHERPNGQGYPRNLTDDRISLYAKIVGTADAYDAMTSERVYRPGMLPADALQIIEQLRGVQFNEDITQLLLESVAPYPVGSLVTLNNREVGVVVDVNQSERSRPVVRLLYKANGKKIHEYTEVDLAKERCLSVIEAAQ